MPNERWLERFRKEKKPIVNIEGNTCLLDMCINHCKKSTCIDVVKLLLDNGANANAVNKDGFKVYDMTDDVELVKIFSEELGMPNLKTIKELLEEEQFDVVAKRFEINIVEENGSKLGVGECSICCGEGMYKSNCAGYGTHSYCFECYLHNYRSGKCAICRSKLGRTLFVSN